MITEALPLRTESPSITEVISDQQPEDHTSQLACCQHLGPLTRVVGVGGLAVLSEINASN